MKILVTGGGGYIGSALSIELAKQGHEVIVIDAFFYDIDVMNKLTKFGIRVVPVKLFIAGANLVSGCDVIFHLAAIAGSKACDEAGEGLVQEYNVKNTDKLVHLLGDELLIFTSTSAIYGDPSLYTISKHEAEGKITRSQNFWRPENFIIVRLPTIFGVSPCMRENTLVHDLVKSAVYNGYIVLWDKDSMRTWMPLEDCINGLISLIEHQYLHLRETENIDGRFMSKKRIAGIIGQFTGCEIFYSDRKGKYVQDFREVPFPKFRYKQNILGTIKELVTYYEGTKHSPTIDWSK